MEERYYQQQQEKRREARQERELKSLFEKEKEAGTTSALPDDKRLRMADAVFKLKDIRAMKEDNAYEKALKQGKGFTKIDDILDSEDFSDEEKTLIVESLGVSRDDADYYNIARQTIDAKAAYVMEAIGNAQTNGIDPLELLKEQRKEVNGKMILSDGVIDELVAAGLLTKAQGKELKRYKFNKTTGTVEATGSGGSSKLDDIFRAAQKDLDEYYKLKDSLRSYKGGTTALRSILAASPKPEETTRSRIEELLRKRRQESLNQPKELPR
jgi:hypothetical protein